MLFSVDCNDRRTHIDDTQSNREYYCPYCGAPLITKKGDVRLHHFAHKASHLCSDTWELTRSYDISPWHNEWQDMFPKENQEIRLSLGQTKHRADVLTGRTVIEFQHSIMSSQVFDDRNNFYYNLGYKVVWLFDISDSIDNGAISYSETGTGDNLTFSWRNPKKAFNSYDIKTGCIDLFFQIADREDSCIVRVLDVSERGFEEFQTSRLMNKKEFLNYVGMKDGHISLPEIEHDEKYQEFAKKYNISLNRQQERAVQAIEGSVLLLAVPGSGKTTVLVDRLGYMVKMRGIDPANILAITYNTTAADEMRHRFNAKYGDAHGKEIDFRTINSLSLWIYSDFCKREGREARKLIEGKDQKKLFGDIYRQFHKGGYASESDLLSIGTLVNYVKNMMLEKEQIAEFDEDYPQFSLMYSEYQKWLSDNNRMDFDDQMVYAYSILAKRPEELARWKHRFNYICVDEAQDTSKIQHAIIHLLAQDNNLFMVGDEDQSIYGFRAAYPMALLNFRVDYKNPYILRMERNYRSTPQIVEKAQLFISQNKGRYEKNMVSDRENGTTVDLIHAASQDEQYSRILEIAQSSNKSVAFLFRDNESSVVLVDMFRRNSIDFRLKKPEANYFEHIVVKDICAYLSLAVNPQDMNAFSHVCNRGILFIKNQQRDFAINDCKNRKMSIYDALDKQMDYVSRDKKDRASKFRKIMQAVSSSPTKKAIETILDEGYSAFMEKEHYDIGKARTLLLLAKSEPNIKAFLNHLVELENVISQGISSENKNSIVLSTIHSSKGQEYDTVYLLDVFDGRFPTAKKDVLHRSKDSNNGEQEERRLFYVGLTRAKNKLAIFCIDPYRSTFIDDVFPEVKIAREAEEERIRQAREAEERRLILQRQAEQAQQRVIIEQRRKILEEKQRILEEQRRREQEEQRKKQLEEEEKRRLLIYEKMYDEVKDSFTQQHMQIRDSRGVRWVKCEICGSILPDKQFSSYGGQNHINLGVCTECDHKKRNR